MVWESSPIDQVSRKRKLEHVDEQEGGSEEEEEKEELEDNEQPTKIVNCKWSVKTKHFFNQHSKVKFWFSN